MINNGQNAVLWGKLYFCFEATTDFDEMTAGHGYSHAIFPLKQISSTVLKHLLTICKVNSSIMRSCDTLKMAIYQSGTNFVLNCIQRSSNSFYLAWNILVQHRTTSCSLADARELVWTETTPTFSWVTPFDALPLPGCPAVKLSAEVLSRLFYLSFFSIP